MNPYDPPRAELVSDVPQFRGLERAIASVFPGWAAKRERARAAIPRMRMAAALFDQRARKTFAAGYESASHGRRTAGWHAGSGSADVEIGPALSRLRNRSRDLTRNNRWVVKALSSIESNVVGTGILPTPRSENARRNKRVLDLYREWGETPQCDKYGQSDLYGIQLLAMREIAEAGEVFIRLRYVSTSEGLAVPIQLELLESDHLDTSLDGVLLPDGGRIRQGIEYDPQGRRRAYYLFRDHPGDQLFYRGLVPDRVDARDVLHCYRMERIGQGRGVPWAAAAMVYLRDFDEFQDAHLLREKIANLFAGFEHDMDGSIGAEQSALGIPASPSTPDVREVEPGAWLKLSAGKQITFSDPPEVQGYRDFAHITLMGIAAAFGVPYEELTGDYSEVNYSSARMARITYLADIYKWQWTMFIPRLLSRVWHWFTAASWQIGRTDDACPCLWTPPRPQLVDPPHEWPAYKEAVRSGFLTLSEAIRQQGYDPDRMLEEYAADLKRLDALGLKLDTDPRRSANGGASAQTSAQNGAGAEPNKPGKGKQKPDDESETE